MSSNLIDAHFVRCWNSFAGALAGALAFLGDKSDLEYQMGATGFAFRINIGDRVCPSSPTAFFWEHFLRRALMVLGYDCRLVEAFEGNLFFKKRLAEARALIKESIDSGAPVIGWDLDVAEFGIIRGYDDESREYQIEGVRAEEQVLTLPYDKLGAMSTKALFVLTPTEKIETDPIAVAKRSIRYAIFHARTEAPISKAYQTGLDAYGKWVEELQRGRADPLGNSYNASVVLEARVAAAKYLREIAGHFAGTESELIAEAASHYARVADALLLFTGLFTFPGDAEVLREEMEVRKGVGWLSQARLEEARAVELLERVCAGWQR